MPERKGRAQRDGLMRQRNRFRKINFGSILCGCSYFYAFRRGWENEKEVDSGRHPANAERAGEFEAEIGSLNAESNA